MAEPDEQGCLEQFFGLFLAVVMIVGVFIAVF
jgi:hypothetical protein